MLQTKWSNTSEPRCTVRLPDNVGCPKTPEPAREEELRRLATSGGVILSTSIVEQVTGLLPDETSPPAVQPHEVYNPKGLARYGKGVVLRSMREGPAAHYWAEHSTDSPNPLLTIDHNNLRSRSRHKYPLRTSLDVPFDFSRFSRWMGPLVAATVVAGHVPPQPHCLPLAHFTTQPEPRRRRLYVYLYPLNWRTPTPRKSPRGIAFLPD